MPYSGSPKQKHRHFPSFHGSQESYSGMRRVDAYGPRSRDHREPHRWREHSGDQPFRFPIRPAPMDRRRVPLEHMHWESRPHNPVHGYPALAGSQHEPRRQPHPALWSGGSSPEPHVAPTRAPFRGRSPPMTPRRFHSEGGHRRSWTPSPLPHRLRDVEQERSWVPAPMARSRRAHRPREHWNGEGGFGRPRSRERRFSLSPQRKSQEFHGRSPFPERFSAERETRTRGGNEVEREGGRRSSEWGHKPSPRRPHKSPKWRAAPSSTTTSAAPPSSSSSPRFHHATQDRTSCPSMKRRNRDKGLEFEHVAKRARREASQRPAAPRAFGGRPLSLKEKSRLVKGRMLRVTSELDAAPHCSGEAEKVPKQRCTTAKDTAEKEQLSDGKSASQEGAKVRSLKKHAAKKVPCKVLSAPEGSDGQLGSTETLTIKVDTRHSLSTYSSSPSPTDRQISRDLVTISQRGMASRAGTCTGASWRTRDSRTENCSSPPGQQSQSQTLTLNERFSKLQNQRSSQDKSNAFSGLRIERKIDVPLMNHRTTKLKNPPSPKPATHSASPERKPPARGPGPVRCLGTFRKPLMATQSICIKYRPMQALRHRGPTSYSQSRGPPHPRGPFFHRW